MLSRQSKRRPARREDEQAGRREQQVRHDRERWKELFEVVENEEQRPLAHPVDNRFAQRMVGFGELERSSNRIDDQVGIVDCREIDENHIAEKLGRQLLCDREREACLAGSAGAGEGDEPHVVLAKQCGNSRDLEPASDQRSRRTRKPVRERRLRGGQRRIVAQDRALQLLQGRPGLDAELGDEQPSCRVVGVKRLFLPPRAVEREQVLLAESLAVRMFGDQLLEACEQRVMAAGREFGVVEQLHSVQPARLERCGGVPRHRMPGEIGERRAGPQVERAAQPVGGL